MGNKSPSDRKIEAELIEFTAKLRPDMQEKDVLKLYEEVISNHWLAESKVLLMRTIFHSILEHQETAETFGFDTRGNASSIA